MAFKAHDPHLAQKIQDAADHLATLRPEETTEWSQLTEIIKENAQESHGRYVVKQAMAKCRDQYRVNTHVTKGLGVTRNGLNDYGDIGRKAVGSIHRKALQGNAVVKSITLPEWNALTISQQNDLILRQAQLGYIVSFTRSKPFEKKVVALGNQSHEQYSASEQIKDMFADIRPKKKPLPPIG